MDGSVADGETGAMLRIQQAFGLVAFLLAGAAARAQLPVYDVEFLGSVGTAGAIDELGRVIGTGPLAPAAERAWVASRSTAVTYLPLPPGRMSSRVYDINRLGQIVGSVSSTTYADASFGGVAALWTPNGTGGYTVQELGKLVGDTGSVAKALNDIGDIVGFSQGQYQRAVLFTAPSGIVDLTPTGAFDPVGVNNARQVACYWTRAARLDLGTMVLEDLGLPVGSYSSTHAIAINEAGDVAAVATRTSTTCPREAARYRDGQGWQILSVCGSSNGPGNLNDIGDITYWNTTAAYVRFAGFGAQRLVDLLDPFAGTWNFFSLATGLINDQRQVVLSAWNPASGQQGTILLVPRESVGTVTCTGDGAFGPCPCANESAPGAFEGCEHSGGQGARISASGSEVVGSGPFALHVTGGPALKGAVFVQGPQGPATPFADGRRCMGTPSVRLETLTLDAQGAATTSVDVAAVGGVVPGLTRVYQVWFRDPTGPCAQTSNLSSGLRIDWR